MFGQMFPGVGGNGNRGSITKANSLAISGHVGDVAGDIPSEMVPYYILPDKITDTQVLEAAENSSELEAEAWLHTQMKRHYSRSLKSMATMYTNQLEYAEEVAKTDLDIQQKRNKYAKMLTRYDFMTNQTASGLESYRKTFSSVGTKLHFDG